MERAVVHFIRCSPGESAQSLGDKASILFEKAGFAGLVSERDLVAVKMHFGETGNRGFVKPPTMARIVAAIRTAGGKPFLTDSNVLYSGPRSNAVDHLALAAEHGFTLEHCGAPVIIADGVAGVGSVCVPIPGTHFKEVNVCRDAVAANVLVAVTHVTGHLASGLGGAIKNIGMGLATRGGKLCQHSDMIPVVIQEKCTACGACPRWCPVEAIQVEGRTAVIDAKRCISCGECLAICRHGAIRFSWGNSARVLQERMAEHALGVVKDKRGKSAFLSFLTFITQHCDCMATKDEPSIPDIGILASTDPVAIDRATLDVIKKETGRSLEETYWPELDGSLQLRHGEKIGLGTSRYELVESKG